MKKSIVRTSLALAVAGVLGTSVVAFVDDIEITGVILFILYVLSWHAIREATEDFIRNGGGKGCNFKSRDAFMTLRPQ